MTTGKINNSGLINVTSGTQVGSIKLLSQTASSSSNLVFTGLSSVYSQYLFIFYQISAATTNDSFRYQVSGNGGSTYSGNNSNNGFYFHGSTQTNFSAGSQPDVILTQGAGIDSSDDGMYCGELKIFIPSSTHQIKQFYNGFWKGNTSGDPRICFGWSYSGDTAPIDTVKFYCNSSNIASGVITMFGIPV